jgi:hypothetical protein
MISRNLLFSKLLTKTHIQVHYGGYEANKDFKEEWAMWNPRRNGYYKWRDKFLSYDHSNEGVCGTYTLIIFCIQFLTLKHIPMQILGNGGSNGLSI